MELSQDNAIIKFQRSESLFGRLLLTVKLLNLEVVDLKCGTKVRKGPEVLKSAARIIPIAKKRASSVPYIAPRVLGFLFIITIIHTEKNRRRSAFSYLPTSSFIRDVFISMRRSQILPRPHCSLWPRAVRRLLTRR